MGGCVLLHHDGRIYNTGLKKTVNTLTEKSSNSYITYLTNFSERKYRQSHTIYIHLHLVIQFLTLPYEQTTGQASVVKFGQLSLYALLATLGTSGVAFCITCSTLQVVPGQHTIMEANLHNSTVSSSSIQHPQSHVPAVTVPLFTGLHNSPS